MNIVSLIQNNMEMIIIILAIICLMLFVMILVVVHNLGKVQNKYNEFVQGSDSKNIEQLLNEYLKGYKKIDENQKNIYSKIDNIEVDLKKCIKKTGMIRFNPFEEMGGDQCFALAMLNEEDDGAVITGILSREGSYVYGKPIINGESTYRLSEEELKAIKKSKEDYKNKARANNK